jgi:murein L,D-transpeptidase YcbB/YkuD
VFSAILGTLAVCAAAPTGPVDVFGALASALAEHDAASFLRHFDPGMPELDRLAQNAAALAEQADVVSSIDFLGRKEEGGETVVQVDWAMTLQSRNGAAGGPTERRREILTARLKHAGNAWRIASIEPLAFFDPPHF